VNDNYNQKKKRKIDLLIFFNQVFILKTAFTNKFANHFFK